MQKHITAITGSHDSGSAYLISRIIKQEGGKHLILAATETRARILAEDLSFFLERDVVTMPGEDHLFLSFEARSQEAMLERLKALSVLRSDPNAVVVAPVSAAVKKMMPHVEFEGRSLHISYGQNVNLEELPEKFLELGYERTSRVDSPGQFSIRGGIVDIYVPDAQDPYRVEFFDTEVDSIRSFSLETQRSLHKLEKIQISPAKQILADRGVFQHASKEIHKTYTQQVNRLVKAGKQEAAAHLEKRRDELCEYVENTQNVQLLENYLHYFYSESEYLWDYLGEGSLTVDDPDRILEFLESREKEQKADFDILLERGQVVPKDYELLTGTKDFLKVYNHRPTWILTPFPKTIRGVERLDALQDFPSRQMVNFNGKMDLLEQSLKEYIKKDFIITIVSSSEERIKSLKDFVLQLGIAGKVKFKEGNLSTGLEFPAQRLCYIADSNLFGSSKKTRRKKKSSIGQQLESFTDLKVGDYVVHENHGIGKFLGIEQLAIQGEKKDYLKIQYAGTDLLYVPVEQFDIVQKYIGADGQTPKIHKLSGTEWKMTKARARKAIEDMTEELVKLYAEREMEKGFAFSEDTVWQSEFEAAFPFQETDDQLRSIREIKEDMEKPESMDRLLCGDVGFGKTEVAARAIFKCLVEGKQAALLAPTTLLANQHFYTLKTRFENFPFKIEVLSRFRSEQEQKEILKELEKGQVDFIIGTHRLFSDDVKFKDLGLLVIDEEQRFGVKHKEKIKTMKKNVDVLTLSATPIPRTLNMSLTGIKNMSVLEEPPNDRYPVQTYVMEQDDAMMKEVLSRELERGGQAYVVYNRVNGITKIAERISELLPEARVAVGHGRMNEQTMENVMLDFVEGRSDILVATTIIESGIDIPNANTMIILNADHFGLAQLYQLRGRVGRSNRMAYAYLMYQKNKILTEVAEKRLRTIREFTEFGSGFKVAMRDLQIRGAGNLLGSAQSGHMMAIGYELYCKLVNDAVRKLRGEAVVEETEETSVELVTSANIPNWYIENEALKIETYKKIASVATEQDEDDLFEELIDRFGDVPRETENLIKISRIRSLAESLAVKRVFEQSGKIVFAFGETHPLTPKGILEVNQEFGTSALVNAGSRPFIRIPLVQKTKLKDSIRLLEAVAKGK